MLRENGDGLNLSMFKAYDIRTPSDRLTLDLSERLAHAIAHYFRHVLNTGKVVLCKDARISGARYLEQGIEVFRSLGFEVLVYPMASSTCMFYFSCMQHRDAAGIMYSASHNPGRDIGLKIIGPDLQPVAMGCGPQGGLQRIKEIYSEDSRMPKGAAGHLRPINYVEKYVDYSMELAGVKKGELAGLKIIMDFLSGTAGFEFLQAFDIAGARVDARNMVPDGTFPSGEPNPVIKESIQPTLDRLSKKEFLFGICFDGDGDRMDLLDSGGKQLSPAFNIAIIAPRIRKLFENTFGDSYAPQFYADLKANPLAVVELAKNGFGVHMIRNGHSQIKQALRNNLDRQFLGAVEESAHYYLNFPATAGGYRKGFIATENTLFFGLLTAKAWFDHPEKYEFMRELQDSTFREREWGYKFPDNGKRILAMKEIEDEFLKRGGRAVKNMADGTDLEATIMREGLPSVIEASTEVRREWTQVSQRISQSEEGLARWEVLAGTEDRKEEAVQMIENVARNYTDSGKYIG